MKNKDENISTLSWEYIYESVTSYKNLEFDCDYVRYEILEIKTEKYNLHNHTCWVQKNEMYQPASMLYNVYLEKEAFMAPRGTFRSAELLHIYQNEDEKKVLILLKMFLMHFKYNNRDKWSRDKNKIFTDIEAVVNKRSLELDLHRWHGRVKKTMPFSITHYMNHKYESYFDFKTFDDIIDIFVLEMNYLFNKYQLVTFIDPTHDQKMEERRKLLDEALSNVLK